MFSKAGEYGIGATIYITGQSIRDAMYSGRGCGLKMCNENNPCPGHHQFISAHENLKEMLETTTEKLSVLKEGQGFIFLNS